MYGQIATRDLLDAESSLDVVSAERLAKRARATVEGGQKVQLVPMKQPEDLFVFSSFYSREVLGKRYYYVTIYYDPPRNPSK